MQPLDIVRAEHLFVRDDLHLGVQALIDLRADSTLRSPTRSFVWTIWRWRLLRSTTSKSTMPDRPDTRRREVQRGRRTEAARADEEGLGAQQLGLAGRADLGDEQVAAVALLLLGGGTTGVTKSRPAPFQDWNPPLIDATFV
jgi:hypothetical protein